MNIMLRMASILDFLHIYTVYIKHKNILKKVNYVIIANFMLILMLISSKRVFIVCQHY
jgi:hypothetical protein